MLLSRREALAGAVALTALGRARAADTVDCLVVGAGAAGLAAARELIRAGRSVAVLEARSRIGGRAFTDTSLGAPFDAGAQYIHWAERNPWRRIAADLGVGIEQEPWGGRPVVYRAGRRLSDAERERRSSAFGRIWSVIDAAGEGDRSFLDGVQGAPPDVVAAAGGITLFSLGEEPAYASLADYRQLWSGDDYVVPTGYGNLVARWGADVPVQLDTPVSAIHWGEGRVRVETARGALQAAGVIVTVPVGVLQAEAIRFVPSLPPETLAALDGLRMGAYTKVVLKLDRSKLEALEQRDFFEIGSDGSQTNFEIFPFGRDLAMALAGGDHGRRLCEAGEAAAVDYVTERLAAMAGGAVRAAVQGGRLAAWWTDPWSRGSYSLAKPGRVPAREALRQPVGGRVYFAGEATAGGGAMTVGGATLDGIRAAQDWLKVKAG